MTPWEITHQDRGIKISRCVKGTLKQALIPTSTHQDLYAKIVITGSSKTSSDTVSNLFHNYCFNLSNGYLACYEKDEVHKGKRTER